MMKIEKTALAGVLLITPDVFDDTRGFFLESFHGMRFHDAGINLPFVQDNHSRSQKNVLRGLHFQKENPQGKLTYVSTGAVFEVVVDINPASSTYKQYISTELNDANHKQLYIPPGYAHGFCVLSNVVDLHYKCTAYYAKNDQCGVIWNDADIAIDWPVKNPLLSDQDQQWPALKEIS